MLKKARLLTRHPGAPRRTLSAGKTAVSEEARRTLRYVEPLSDTRYAVGGLFQHPDKGFLRTSPEKPGERALTSKPCVRPQLDWLTTRQGVGTDDA